jgi:hypothetical protein
MSEKVHTIFAGSHPVYEIIVSKSKWEIRHTDDHEKSVEFMPSVVPMLIDVLQKALRESQS